MTFKSLVKEYWSEVFLVLMMMLSAYYMVLGTFGKFTFDFLTIFVFIFTTFAFCGIPILAKALSERRFND